MVVGGRELIDTLWNVNFLRGFCWHSKSNELIDTLWNVNILIPALYKNLLRINRYIMECK